MILLHSSGMSGRQWASLIAAGAERWRFVVPDLLGSGQTEAWRGPGAGAMGADRELVDALIEAEPGAHLVGHSYGGTLALLAAATAPGAIRSVAAFEPPLLGPLHGLSTAPPLQPIDHPPSRDDPELWMAWLVDWWNGEGTFARLGTATRAGLLASAEKVMWEVKGQLADRTPLSAFEAVDVPVLLLRGGATPALVAYALEQIAAACPQARLEQLCAVGHMGPLTHPSRVNARILAHLDAVQG